MTHFSLNSMTAFAYKSSALEDHSIATWEIKTVNHRYLDIQLRLPSIAQSLEPIIRKRVKDKLKRGRVEIRLNYQSSKTAYNLFILNEDLARQVCRHHDRINQIIESHQKIDAFKLLNFPGVLQSVESNSLSDSIYQAILALLDQTLSEVCHIRANEGQMIQKVLLDYLNQLNQYVQQITHHLPAARARFHEKLVQRFNEAKLQVNTERFEQELVFALQKMDVSEELERLKMHLTELKKQVTGLKVSGTRLDFLMQELSREANTLGAKSTEATINLAVVEMKVLIEAMREQIQNVQ